MRSARRRPTRKAWTGTRRTPEPRRRCEGVDQAAGGGGTSCRGACGEQFDEQVVRAKEANGFRSKSVEEVAERGSGAPRKDGVESARLAEDGVGGVVAQAAGSSVVVEAAGPCDGGAEVEEVVARERRGLPKEASRRNDFKAK